MHEGRLHEWREPVVVDGHTEVREEPRHLLGRGRYKVGPTRVVVVPPDPVLLRSYDTSNGRVWGVSHHLGVNGNDLLHTKVLRARRRGDGLRIMV